MIYILVLNSIRERAEHQDAVAVSRDREAMVKWIEEQRHRNPETGEFESWTEETKRSVDTLTQVGVVVDYTWRRVFKEGSPLQDFNLPGNPTRMDESTIFPQRVHDPDGPPYEQDLFGCGIIEYPEREEAAEKARQNWDKLISGMFQVEPIQTGG